jgi:hypothetical protein
VFQILALSSVLAVVITFALLGRKAFKLQQIGANKLRPPKQRDGKKSDVWYVPFGVPAALAAWVLMAVELSGRGLPWPPI